MPRCSRTLLHLVLCLALPAAHAASFDLIDQGRLPPIIHDNDRQGTMRLAAELVGRDLSALSGLPHQLATSLDACGQRCVVIGTLDSPLVQQAAKLGRLDLAALRGQWERYVRVVLEPEGAGGRQVLLIAGADRRGGIYGAVDMTRELGVSPWEWWADVTPQRSARLQLDGAARWSKAPSVQYRGIFLNDEDWGLQPWAAKTYEPEVNDIGPKTYARVFELMWRLKANTVWPAMHAATRPFYEIAGNAETADRYAIVMATSHAEPMARNNTREWDDDQRGPFNYFQNRDAIIRYWGERADQVIADILLAYYDLAFERRPEFMGGGQTEPTLPNMISGYVRTGGAEAQARLDRYSALLARAERLAGAIDGARQDAYFQLVLYPVRGAANLNERILKLDLATVYAKAGRANVNALAQQARAAHQRIVADTAAYAALGQGKWRGMMNMAPRGLPVFDEPLYPQWTLPARGGCKVDASALSFVQGRQGVRHITVYGTRQAAWKLAGHSGFRAVPEQGELNAGNGFEQRVAIHYDGKDPVEGGAVQCLDRLMGLFFRFSAPAGALPQEVDRIISIDAASVSGEGWKTVPGLGSRGSALRSRLDLASAGASVDSGALAGITPLRYRFATGSKTDATLKLVALPVHPLTSLNRLRLAVRLDGGALQVLDFETFGRSEEWKRNVLSNTAVRTLALSQLPEGEHTLDVYALDPGFILDRIDVLLDGAADLYGAPPIAGAV